MADFDAYASLPLIREGFPRTIRLVASARLREAVLAPLADSEDELDALNEVEGSTSARLIAEHRGIGSLAPDELVYGVPYASFINASFVYAKPRQAMRFNPATRGAWYAALDIETCIAEVGFHLTRALADVDDFNAVVDYGEMIASMSGLFVDLRTKADHPSLDPNIEHGYAEGNRLAAWARSQAHNGIVYPSVRRQQGICIVALRPGVVQSVVPGGLHRLTWSGTADFTWVQLSDSLS